MDNRWTLQDKKALVTGGTKGIGLAIVNEFLELGAKVIFTARTKSDVEKLEEQLCDKYSFVKGIVADASIPEDREKTAQVVENEWDHLDIFINNAGSNIRKKIHDYTQEEIDYLINLLYKPAIDFSRRLLPQLKKSEQGNVVHIASIAGLNHIRTGAIYGSAKAAVIQLTKNLAVEWAEYNIRVNAIAPGFIATPLANQLLQNKEYMADVMARTPLKRVGTAEEISGVAAFLCMPVASYITGQCITPDGGVTVNQF